MRPIHDGSPVGEMNATMWHERRYLTLSTLVLALATFNIGFRLDREVVTEWDEALYAISASEALASGDWVGTTFLGHLDYYNTKPPLNVWLIGLAFDVFGPSLWALRLTSVLAAWLTIVVLQVWVRRCFGSATALTASLVLSMTFGFLYVHAGRSANTDALFTLLTLLTVVTCWASEHRAWRLVWLGPLTAALFLLRGMGVLLPLAIVFVVIVSTANQWRARLQAVAVAGLCAGLLVLPWVVARWQLDGWRFFTLLFHVDFLARITDTLDGHAGTPFFYLHQLQKDQYEWLALAVVASLLYPPGWSRFGALLLGPSRHLRVIVASWAVATLLIPTLMQTKLPWYLNSFFPLFALMVARLVTHACAQARLAASVTRPVCLMAALVLAIGVAEGKILWYSWHMRDVGLSVQGLLLSEREELHGRRVFHTRWNFADRFVLERMAGATCLEVADVAAFMRDSVPGDYWLGPVHPGNESLIPVASNRRYGLYQRVGPEPADRLEELEADARLGRGGGRRTWREGGPRRWPGHERGRRRRRAKV